MNERTRVWAERIDTLIRKCGWTLGDAALHFGVHEGTIRAWRTGRRLRPPSLGFLRTLRTLEEAYAHNDQSIRVTGVWRDGRFEPWGPQVHRASDLQALDPAVAPLDEVRRAFPNRVREIARGPQGRFARALARRDPHQADIPAGLG